MSFVYAYAFLCVFLAGIVRGFSGFAFAALVVISVSFVLPPETVVPAVLILEVIAGIHLLPSIWRTVHWPSITIIVVASILATPLGVYMLANVPAEPMKLALAVITFVAAAILATGYQLKRMPRPAETVATGAAAGLLNGAFGIGGPPIIIFFLGSPLALEAGRASIVASFLAMDIAGLIALFAFGMYDRASLTLTVLALPALVAGVYIGSRLVGRLDEKAARKGVIAMLMILSLMMGYGSVMAMRGG